MKSNTNAKLFLARFLFVITIMFFSLTLIVMLGLLMHNGYLKSANTFNNITMITAVIAAFDYAYIKLLESRKR